MFEMKDVMQEMYDEFPELDEKSLDSICKKGLVGILKTLRADEEMFVALTSNEEIKFFRPAPHPEVQYERTLRNVRRRKRVQLKKENGQEESN